MCKATTHSTKFSLNNKQSNNNMPLYCIIVLEYCLMQENAHGNELVNTIALKRRVKEKKM